MNEWGYVFINLTTSILGSFSHLQKNALFNRISCRVVKIITNVSIERNLQMQNITHFCSRIPFSYSHKDFRGVATLATTIRWESFLRCIREKFLSWESERKIGIVSSIVVQRWERVRSVLFKVFGVAQGIYQTVQSLYGKTKLVPLDRILREWFPWDRYTFRMTRLVGWIDIIVLVTDEMAWVLF